MNTSPIHPRVIFFDRPGGIYESALPSRWINANCCHPSTLFSYSILNTFLALRQEGIQESRLVQFSSNEVDSLSVMQHNLILDEYLQLLSDAASHMRSNEYLLVLVSGTYMQEYANCVYCSLTLSRQEKTRLLERYKKEHRRILQGYVSLRVMITADQEPEHYFSREGIAYRAAKQLNVQDLFSYHESVPNTVDSGKFLTSKYHL